MTLLEDTVYASDIEKISEMELPWEMLSGKTILVTGATGLIVSCLAEFLLWMDLNRHAGVSMILAGRAREKTEERFFPFLEGRDYDHVYFDAASGEDIRLEGKHIDYIVHGASNAQPEAYGDQPVETILANVVGLDTLLKLAAREKDCRVLYISSSEVYGIKNDKEPYSETDHGYVALLDPRSCYPCSKRASETLCAAYQSEYGVDTVIVRPGHVYGPTMADDDRRAAAQFARNAMKGEDIIMKSDGRQLRSYCYVTDCVSAILTVLLKGETGNAYNISNRASVCTVRDVADAFADAGGVRVRYAQPTDLERRNYNAMTNSSLNAAKLESLGWKARISLMEGARRTVRKGG